MDTNGTRTTDSRFINILFAKGLVWALLSADESTTSSLKGRMDNPNREGAWPQRLIPI